MSPDLINGIFESIGGFFITLSVLKLHREKLVRGVSWVHVAFFTSWGIWNLYYYPSLDQWFSFYGGLLLVLVNLIWLGQIAWYLIWEGWDRPPGVPATDDAVPLTISAKGIADREQEAGKTPRFRWSDK